MVVNTVVARPVGKKEIRANPKAQQALDIEWDKLVKKIAWKYDGRPSPTRLRNLVRKYMWARSSEFAWKKVANYPKGISSVSSRVGQCSKGTM